MFTFKAEGDDNPNSSRFSRKLHVFSKSSGVTIGRGYDVRDKKPKQIKKDLVAAGINSKTADKLKNATGLTGDKARKWIQKENLGNLKITRQQQKSLFEIEYRRITKTAMKMIKKYTKNALKFKDLHPVAKDIVVDIFYRGDYSMSDSKKKSDSVYMQKAFDKLSKHNLIALIQLMADQAFWVYKAGVDEARAKARAMYVYDACCGNDSRLTCKANCAG
ncbi:hypothetical protein QZH41_017652 [Actinostola sp. cb2023]|nr:hypothetical protein QZH41_017652 [Actinostola sp. cb2023]